MDRTQIRRLKSQSAGIIATFAVLVLFALTLEQTSGWTEERIEAKVGGAERTVFLPRPLPIHIESRLVDYHIDREGLDQAFADDGRAGGFFDDWLGGRGGLLFGSGGGAEASAREVATWLGEKIGKK